MKCILLTTHVRKCLNIRVIKVLIGSVLSKPVHCTTAKCHQYAKHSHFTTTSLDHSVYLRSIPDVEIVANKIRVLSREGDILSSLLHDESFTTVKVNHMMVNTLLQSFKNDWKSALAVFRWAESDPCFEHLPKACDLMVDILGKARQFDKMTQLVSEMHEKNIVSLETVAKLMRRYAGARHWKDAIHTFDKLESFGLEKNAESMNLLLDTLCKENQVEMARAVFFELKSHILPTAHTFNIFIHGWCKIKRFEEADWTLEEMKGYGFPPSVISYSTIIQFHCRHCNWDKAFELLQVMENQGFRPSVVTYTNVMCSLAKAEEVEDALKVAERAKSSGCKLDTMFYNGFINTLGKAGKLDDAFDVFEIEMPKNGVPPNTCTYNTLIAWFCWHGKEQTAFSILEKMEMENSSFCKPDLQTFYPLLKACFKSGRTDSFLRIFLDDMVVKHHLSLDDSTYSLLIHGFCRVNQCEWAFCLFEEMIRKELIPRYQTCRFLLDMFKQKNMHEAAARVESRIQLLKASKETAFCG